MRSLLSLLPSFLAAAACATGEEPATEVVEGAAVFDPGPGTIFDPVEPLMRSAVLALPSAGTTPVRRAWAPHGAGELGELTGPNDKQVVGDFKQLGYDQLLSINFESACPGRATSCQLRRLVISSFAQAPGSPPTTLYSEAWGQSNLLDGWDDETDLALAGDFLGRGYDQLLLLNRPADGAITVTTPRAKIVDLRGATPVVAFQHDYGHLGLDEMQQLDDRILVGDFRALGRDQVLILNGDPNRVSRALVLHDYASAWGPLVPVIYQKNFVEVPELDTWHDAADTVLTGNFKGYGHDQLLFINRQHGAGRFLLLDLRWSATPLVWWNEAASQYPAQSPWHDALGDGSYAGDFAGLGRDQVLFLNRRGSGDRAVVADFGAGMPATVRYRQGFGPPSFLDVFDDDDDVLVAGRFTPAGDGLLGLNNELSAAHLPERLATSPTELAAHLSDARFRGRIVIPWWVDWTFTAPLPLRTGTQLVGERGPLGARPVLRYSTDGVDFWGLLQVAGHHILVQGLHLIGPADDNRSGSQKLSTAILGNVDVARQKGLYVTVFDNELERWTFATYALGNDLSYRPGQVDQRVPRQAPEDAPMIRFERNYVHHNHRNGAGYGVNVGGGVYITIAGNVFDRNRHAVSAGGYPHSGYSARHNFVLQGGYTESGFLGIDYWNQHFDVHGTADSGYGGLAGELFVIEDNTVRGEQDGRPAFTLRGRPSLGAFFRNNVVVHDDLDEAVSLKMSKSSSGIGEDHAEFNFHPEPGNTYDTDYIDQLASGDFDGDGRADVFLATGTAWFVSHSGTSEWRYLRSSRLVRAQLAFADVDHDGKTDVVWRDGSGWLTYARGGGEAQGYLTTTPAAIDEHRFFDLTGDGKTDIFRVSGAQWLLWDSTTNAWTVIQALGGAIAAMRFGAFDGIAGVDVAMAVSGYWQFSSGGRSEWRLLNTAWQPSLATTAAVDVDRDGRTDLVWREGSQWKWSRYGLFSPQVLRSGIDAVRDGVDAVLWGNWNGAGATDALRWRTGEVDFWLWSGLGSADSATAVGRTMK